MLLSNIQDNIMKAPLVQAHQARGDIQSRAEAGVMQSEQLAKGQAAAEHVRELNPAEHQTIRDDHEHPEDRENPRRKPKWRGQIAQPSSPSAGTPDEPQAGSAPSGHVDVTV